MTTTEFAPFPRFEDRPWSARAACTGLTQLFFPGAAERPQARLDREARARIVCTGCEALEDCRAFARRHREYGFWGGESEEERHAAGYRLIAPIGVRTRAG